MTGYSECEKLAKNNHRRIEIINFLEWLAENEMLVAKWAGQEDYERIEPINDSKVKLAHRYLEIDEIKLEAERSHMLHEMQEKSK